MENTLEKIEDAVHLDSTVKVAKIRAFNRFMRQGWVLPTATAVGGALVGAAFGYLFTKKQYDKIENDLEKLQSNQIEFDFATAALNEDIHRTLREAHIAAVELKEAANLMLAVLAVTEDVRTEIPPDADDQEGAEALREDHPSAVSKARPLQSKPRVVSRLALVEQDPGDRHIEVSAVTTNVFDNSDDDWDYKKELESRGDTEPYIVHVDEFMADENGWDSKTTLTYYAGDDVLCDSHDRPMYDAPEIVGTDLKFGHGSKDPNVVYIRNPRLRQEFEILRDPSSYETEVLGEKLEKQAKTADLRHSHQRKFRDI